MPDPATLAAEVLARAAAIERRSNTPPDVYAVVAYDVPALAARLAAAEGLLAEVATKLPVYTIDGGLWWRCAWCKVTSESGIAHAADCLAERIAAHRAGAVGEAVA